MGHKQNPHVVPLFQELYRTYRTETGVLRAMKGSAVLAATSFERTILETP